MQRHADIKVCRRKFLGGMACTTGALFLGRLLDNSVAAASAPEKIDHACTSGDLHPTINVVRSFRLPFGIEPATVFRPSRPTKLSEEANL